MSTSTERTLLLTRIKTRHPDRIPVIVSRKEGSALPLPANTKFLVPKVFKMASFVQILREELDADKDKSIFVFNKKNKILKMDLNIEEVYQDDMDDDGFLYLTYSELKSFG